MITANEIVHKKVGTVYQQFAQQDVMNHEKVGEHFEKAKQWLTDRLSQGRFIFEWS